MHTFARLGVPFTMMRIFWMLGFQRRRDRRCECEILFPKPGVFPQTSHTEDIRSPRLPEVPAGSEKRRCVSAPA